MRGTRVAIRYAQALLEKGQEEESLLELYSDMKDISDSLEASKELGQVLENPTITSDKKVIILKAIFPKLNKLTVVFIEVLAKNKRINFLYAVAKHFIKLNDQISGKVEVEVLCAISMTKSIEKEILDKVKRFLGDVKEISIKSSIDTSILGGFILKIGDLQYDASALGRLKNLEKQIIN